MFQASSAKENFTLRFAIIFPLIVSQAVVAASDDVIVIVSAFHFFFTLAVASRTKTTQQHTFPLPIALTQHSAFIYLFHTEFTSFRPKKTRSTLRQTEREEEEKAKHRRREKKVTAIVLESYAAQGSSVHLQLRHNTD